MKSFKEMDDYELVEYIEKHWEEAGCAETGMEDADCFLGYETEDMSQEEIDEAVSEIQLAYYTEGPAGREEMIEKCEEIRDTLEQEMEK